jgi:hypothetical protein
VYAWSDVELIVQKLADNFGATCPFLCDKGVKASLRAPKFLTAPKSIPIPKSVLSLFPICLSLGSVIPAFESALIEAAKPASISLCIELPCKDKVAAVVAAAAGSFPSGSQV